MSLGSMKLAVAPADCLDTLPPWPWDILDDEAPRTLGWHAIAWAEGWTGFPGLLEGWKGLTQPNGPRSGKPFRLTERQRVFRLWFYALDDEAQWVYAAGRRRLAKGSGKSPDAAVFALTEFLGPVRLATFRRDAPGGCEGRPVDMPLVQIAATAESQTANTMRMVRAFAPKRSHVVQFYNLDPGKTIYYGLPERTLQVITSSVTASEGAEASFVVDDELEHWKPSNAGPELAATLEDNLAKSGARSIGTGNAWVPGIESVAESDWDAWVAEQEGRIKADAGRILYDAVIAPPDTDMGDFESLKAALEWVYGDCDWKRPHEPDPNRAGDLRPVPGSKPDVRPIIKRIWSPKAKADDSKRKYLNRPTVAEDAWTTPEEWAVLTDPTRVVADGEDVVLFFDGSKSRDATALIGCCVEDGHVFTVDVWEPDPAHDTEDVVPVAEVDLTVRRSPTRWKVVGFFGDVQEWETFVKVSWPESFPDLEVMAVPSGKDPQPVAWDMRGRVYEFTAAAELTLDEIQSRTFTHDGDSRTARHIGNCRRRPNRYGISVGKESPSSPKKIDAAVCVIGARMVRRQVLAERAKRPQKSKRAGRVVGWG
jgi:hypothetical protein